MQHQVHYKPPHSRAHSILLALTWLIFGAQTVTAAPSSKPATAASKRPQSWHKAQVASRCGVQPAQVRRVKRYALPVAAGYDAVTAAVIQTKGDSTAAVAVLYQGQKAAHCITFRRFPCKKYQRPCTHSVRAFRLIDLKADVSIDRASGSWYEAPLQAGKKLAWPALALQSSVRYGPPKARQTREETSLLWLRSKAAPVVAFRTMSLELWSPKHQALKRMEAGGVKMESMQLEQRKGFPPKLTVVKKGIPTALNRCICKRLDEAKEYRLTSHGFRRFHSL